MTDNDLLSYLAERAQRLGQLASGSPAAENNSGRLDRSNQPQKTERENSAETTKPLIQNINSAVYPFLRSREEGTQTLTCMGAGEQARTGGRARAFNSIYSFRNRGETEKKPEYPSNSAELGFSVPPRSNVDLYVKTGDAAVCCLCDKPIDSVDTFWGAEPAHRPCAEAAFLANKAAGRYRP